MAGKEEKQRPERKANENVRCLCRNAARRSRSNECKKITTRKEIAAEEKGNAEGPVWRSETGENTLSERIPVKGNENATQKKMETSKRRVGAGKTTHGDGP